MEKEEGELIYIIFILKDRARERDRKGYGINVDITKRAN